MNFVAFRDMAVLEQLSTRGAEADIYLLRDGAEGKCVLKLYRHGMEPKPKILERIRGISRAHPDHLVALRDAGFDRTAGRWFELLEYLPRGSLKDVPVGLKRDPEFIKKLVPELAGVIHCLHENDIIHCDVKPGNVLVRSLDPLDLVLTDFGIASLLDADTSRKMTALKGTPSYRAPEAFSRMAGRSGDWWGLGMIALELLAGEHPFAGLSEAQILHRLTVGDVGIPGTVAAEWRPLLRGLLTKDDAKRWGYAEVARWLTGEQNIPVHDGSPSSAATGKPQIRPFRFEGRDYYSPKDLARALCENEAVWRRATKYANYFRPWLESSGMSEEACRVGAFESLDPDAALARFVYTCAEGPFVWLGHVLDIDGLRRMLKRTVNGEAEETERRIVALLESESLFPLYDTWTRLSGNSAPQLHMLLEMTKGKPLPERWTYLEALQNPEIFLWPGDVSTQSRPDTLDALARLQVLPLRRNLIEELRTSFLLPTCLLRLFERAESYAEGRKLLTELRERELLIRKDNDEGLRPSAEDLGLDEYEARARVLCWGHTPETLEQLNVIEAGLRKCRRSSYQEILEAKFARLNALRQNRITATDRRFLDGLETLLKQRASLKWRWLTEFLSVGLMAGVPLIFVKVKRGDILTERMPGVLLFLLECALAGLYLKIFHDEETSIPPEFGWEMMVTDTLTGVLLVLCFLLGALALTVTPYENATPLLVPILAGGALSFPVSLRDYRRTKTNNFLAIATQV